MQNIVDTIRGLAVILDRDLVGLLNPTVQKNLTVQSQGK
jgi:hypothetical protein